MQTFIRATVVSVDPRPDRLNGIVELDKLGIKATISGNDFGHFRIVDGKVHMFRDAQSIVLKVGDRIAVLAPDDPDDDLTFCRMWGFETDYDKLSKETDSVYNPLYRVLAKRRIVGTEKWGSTMMAVGPTKKSDLGGLAYEQHGYWRLIINPMTSGQTEIKGWWEISEDEGKTWEQCECPSEYMNECLEG